MPGAVFFRRAHGANGECESSAFMLGFGTASGLATGASSTNLQTRHPALGQGASNDGQYSNPEFDRLLAEAAATLDDARRLALVQQATQLAMEDQAILPVLHIKAAGGLRRGLDMQPRGDGYTFATTIRPAP